MKIPVVRKSIKVVKVQKKPKSKKSRVPKTATFGPVATIDTAPVAIGNSVKGSAPIVVPIEDGVRIQGRDFFCNIAATAASITTWTMVGGAPLIPHALVSSLLKSYAGIYAHFVIHGMAFHYITACPSSVQGDVMFYIGKSLADPCINFSSANFMSVVLSDHCTVFGPLWQNHTASYFPPREVYPTDILNDEDLTHRGPGELIMFTKSTTDQVPGYVLMDYDISFVGMQVNVRALTFPISRMKYTQVALFLSSAAVTAGTNRAALGIGGTALDGTTTLTAPSGAAGGDVYKCIINVTASTFTNVTAANLLVTQTVNAASTATASYPLADGYTFYAVYYTTNALLLFPTYQDACEQVNWMFFGVSATISVNMPTFVSLVGTTGSVGLSQSAI